MSKQPFLDWGMALDDEDKKFTLEQLAEDSTALGSVGKRLRYAYTFNGENKIRMVDDNCDCNHSIKPFCIAPP